MDTCDRCNKTLGSDGFSAGYGIDMRGMKYCYGCCALNDAEQMRRDNRITLYLAKDEVTNWPGSLRIPVRAQRIGRHNMAGKRYDVWFRFAGKQWHGVQYGDNTQICHCRATA